jgi:hypothetical protein
VFADMRRGGITAANCTCSVWEGFHATMANLARFQAWFRAHADLIVQIRTTEDIHRAKREGRTGIVLGFQNVSAFEDQLGAIGLFKELGVGIVQLAYNTQNLAAIDWGDLSTAQPTEVLESRYPLLIEWSRLGADSGGDGRRRGGLGMRRGLRLLAERASYSLLSDGAAVPPFGVLGGQSAAPVDSFVLREGREVRFVTPGKVGGFALQQGDVLVLQSAGGGG